MTFHGDSAGGGIAQSVSDLLGEFSHKYLCYKLLVQEFNVFQLAESLEVSSALEASQGRRNASPGRARCAR
jgi:hypothetical protein